MNFLRPRLLTIASLVSDGEVVADIGTDHAYLSIYLAKANKAKKIYATDIAKKPLEVAKNNIYSFNVSDKVETLLENGISWTKSRNIKISSCIIAGVGSSTILDILKNDNDNIDCYIISSNTNLEPIREWVKKNKYYVEKEVIVLDNDIIYELMKVNKYAGQKIRTKQDLVFGPILKKDKQNKLFLERWMKEEQKLHLLLTKIPEHTKKHKQYKKRERFIKKMLKKEINK